MKVNFKPLALAAAVAATTAGTAGVVNAQEVGKLATLGDFALIPYYTVQKDWVTGIHITNTSPSTQIVKFRMRRAADSDDVLDFNLVLSPYDMWTGTIRGDDTAMEVATADTSCTVPLELKTDGSAPIQVHDGAQEGYIEIIGMASAAVASPIGVGSKHVTQVDPVTEETFWGPLDCQAVTTNFFPNSLNAVAQTSVQVSTSSNPLLNGEVIYADTGNVLKVSYFIRDNASGIEFGGDAVHISDFADQAMMSHQKFGLESLASQGVAALDGWDFPDVTGGGASTGYRTAYQDVVRPLLGANKVLNDWSYNSTTGASTDWVITLPGQYAMVDIYSAAAFALGDPTATWDFREMPVVATFNVVDREENEGIPGGLGFSPSPAPDAALLPNEVNVVTWGPDFIPPVLASAHAIPVDPSTAGIEAATGWAYLNVVGTPKRANVLNGQGPLVDFSVCDHAAGGIVPCTSVKGTPVPMIGFTAWQRTFDDPDKNYGRLIPHAFTVSG